MPARIAPISAITIALATHASIAQTVVTEDIGATLDATLYEHPEGAIANGRGRSLLVGRSGENGDGPTNRRSLVYFDLEDVIPPKSVIKGATIRLRVNRGGDRPGEVSIHRVTRGWGEGDSNDTGPGGQGAAATQGSATWLHNRWSMSFWDRPGGDFVEAPSVSGIPAQQEAVWASAGLVEDVQFFVDNPDQNFGWILIGDETRDQTVRRYDSREIGSPTTRPRLIVTYLPRPFDRSCGDPDLTTDGEANGVPDGAVTLTDFVFFLIMWNNDDPAADITAAGECVFGTGGDGVDLSDFACYLDLWTRGCPRRASFQ